MSPFQRWVRSLLLLPVFCGIALAVGDGELTVITDPEGVEVWVDDNYVGDTPLMNKKLSQGRYTVKLIDALRRTSVSEEIYISAGETTTIEKSLQTKFGSLIIDSRPQGTNVYLMTPLGTSPLKNEFMNPGRYRLEFRHPNNLYKTATEDIEITGGETVTLSPTLEKDNPFDQMALIRLGLGAATAVGFIWAIVEQGKHKELEERISGNPGDPTARDWENQSQSAAIKRTLGIVVGAVCLTGLEIVAFF